LNNFNTVLLAAAVGLALSTAAAAMSKDEHKQAKERIETEYKGDKAGCVAASGNAKDVCRAQAKGKHHVALAELEAGYKPTRKSTYDVRMAKAEAGFTVAKERCDDRNGNAKDVCLKEAKATQVAAKADAQAWLKSADAKHTAKAETAEARAKASGKVAEANKEAAADKREAELKLAITKCDVLAGAAKDTCTSDAKVRYGKL
jgi:hypothetical protein